MNTRDLFEQRATRGAPRGAGAVWRDAREAIDPPADQRPSLGLRLALATLVLVLVVGAIMVRRPDGPTTASTVTSDSSADDTTFASSPPLPAPLLIENATIIRDRGGVRFPSNPGLVDDGLLASIGIELRYEVVFSTEATPSSTTLVFARPEDPFSGPIVGLELLPNDGFRPWGANLDGSDLRAFVDQLQRIDGSWTLPASSGLVPVAEVVDGPMDLMGYGWQFDFGSGDDRTTLQADASMPSRPADEWLWISRLAYGTGDTGGTEMTVYPIEVIGRTGVVIDAGSRAANEVVWSDGDFAYRLTSSTTEDDTDVPRDATEDLGRLQLVARDEWVDAIRASFDVSRISALIVGFALFPTQLAAIAGAMWFLIRRSFLAAAIAAAVAWILWWMGGLGAVELSLAWIGLAIAWWRHRSRTAANIPADARTDP